MSVRKYVGATARSMGSDPAWVAHCGNGRAAVFASREAAREYVRQNERQVTS